MNIVKHEGGEELPPRVEKPLVTSEDVQLQNSISQAEIELALLRSRIQSIIGNIGKMTADLMDYCKDLHEQMRELLAEIASLELRFKQEAYANAPIRESRIADDLDAEFNYEEPVEDEADRVLAHTEEDPDLVKLFRKIAAKTHPDKVSDPALHALFIQAKEFRKAANLKGLQDIWDVLTGKQSQIQPSTNLSLRYLDQLFIDIAYLKHTLEYLKFSDDYKLFSFYIRNPAIVLSKRREQIKQTVRNLSEHLRVMKVAFGEPEKPKLTLSDL